VVDEAHRLKNFDCRLFQQLKQLKSDNRLLLTGTPLQNNLTELWSLLHFILPTVFDSLSNFNSWFNFDGLFTEESKATATNEIIGKLHVILGPFMLRRLKSEVIKDIPKKREIIIYCPFTEVQRAFYDVVTKGQLSTWASFTNSNNGNKQSNTAYKTLMSSLRNVLMQLRKACNHPALLDDVFESFEKRFNESKAQGRALADLVEEHKEKQKEEIEEQARREGYEERGGSLRSLKKVNYNDNDIDIENTSEKKFLAALEKSVKAKSNNNNKAINNKQEEEEDEDEASDIDSDSDDSNRRKKKNNSNNQSDSNFVIPEPKRARSAYQFFINENRPEIYEQLQNGETFDEEADFEEEKKKKKAEKRQKKKDEREEKKQFKKGRGRGKKDSSSSSSISSSSASGEEEGEEKAGPGNFRLSMFIACKRWNNLEEAEREPYKAMAKRDQERYKAEALHHKQLTNSSLIIGDEEEYLSSLAASCGKLKIVGEMLAQLKKDGHKVLIFSQMTRMLDILEDFVELSGYQYKRIDGSTKQQDRQLMINEFNMDPDVFIFLLSTRSGGLGINLTSADTVIIYDSDWNPQMDLQAQDRCHRIGQTKPVCVYRMITANSVEGRMLSVASRKLKLERLVIQKGGLKQKAVLTDEELKMILNQENVADGTVGSDQTPITPAQLKKLLHRETVMSMFDQPVTSPSKATPKKKSSTGKENKEEVNGSERKKANQTVVLDEEEEEEKVEKKEPAPKKFAGGRKRKWEEKKAESEEEGEEQSSEEAANGTVTSAGFAILDEVITEF